MKKMMVVIALMALLTAGFTYAAGNAFGPAGPAPNSGDCIPDGSGFTGPNGQNGVDISGSGNGPVGPAPNSGDGIPDGSGFVQADALSGSGNGPAPNSGDCIPDGSGMTSPNGPNRN